MRHEPVQDKKKKRCVIGKANFVVDKAKEVFNYSSLLSYQHESQFCYILKGVSMMILF